MHIASRTAISGGRFGRGPAFLLTLRGQAEASPSPTQLTPEPAVRTEEAAPRSPSPPRRTSAYVGAGVAVVVVIVALAYLLSGGFHSSHGSSGSTGTVLIPRGTGYSYSIRQFNGIVFAVTSESRIQGELNSSHGVQIYLFTPTEFQYLVRNLTVGQSEWTSGVVANATIYDLDVIVQPGSWVLSFVNPNEYLPTGIGFYTDVTLTAT
jgi:hypothetical protein